MSLVFVTDEWVNNMKIIYEDENVVAIDKSAGLLVHPDGKSKEETVSSWFLDKYPEVLDIGEPIILEDKTEIKKPGIVHRLDRGTSGVLILAKNQETFLFLKEQFKNRNIKKIYNAFVYDKLKETKGVIDRKIGRSANNFKLRSAQRGARGVLRDAITEYSVITQNKEFSFVELRPRTGRTHQLRVHLKAINHPIVCDTLYAPKRECALGFKRLALHSKSLEINISENKKILLESQFPEDFKHALEKLST